MPTNVKNIQDQLTLHLRDQGNLDPNQDLILLAHGEANLIFQLPTDELVRVAVSSPNARFKGDPKQVTYCESLILDYLKGTDISHNLKQVQLKPSATLPYTYLITNYLPGKPLNYSREHLSQCAQTLAHLHRLPLNHKPAESLSPPLLKVQSPLTVFWAEAYTYAQPYLNSASPDPEIVKMLQAALDCTQKLVKWESLLQDYPYTCLVHSDHTHDNWVINQTKAYLIDWEWAEVGTPAGDLGHFLSPITIHRFQDYRLPTSDRSFFLHEYYQYLADSTLVQTIQYHVTVFGAFPPLRSLCWTAGYWITHPDWYDATPQANERSDRRQKSQTNFYQLWQDTMDLIQESLQTLR